MLFWIRTVELSLCWIPLLLLSPHQHYIVHVPLPPPLSQLDTPAVTYSITAYSYNTANPASTPSSNFYSSNTANPASTTFSNFYSSNYVLKLPLLLTQPTQFSLPPQTSTLSNPLLPLPSTHLHYTQLPSTHIPSTQIPVHPTHPTQGTQFHLII